MITVTENSVRQINAALLEIINEIKLIKKELAVLEQKVEKLESTNTV